VTTSERFTRQSSFAVTTLTDATISVRSENPIKFQKAILQDTLKEKETPSRTSQYLNQKNRSIVEANCSLEDWSS